MATSTSTIKPVVVEAAVQHRATIIFLHGLGDTGHGWADELKGLKPNYAKLVCPTAPTSPVTINMGFKMPSWFDIRSLNKDDPNQDEAGIKKASQDILNLIKAEIDGVDGKPGIPAENIVIGGFSQGGALSLYTGLTGPYKLGGIVSLSGYLPISNTIDWSKTQKVPVLQCHGDSDTVVPYEFGTMTSKALQAKGGLTKYSFKTYRGMDHCSCAEELSDVQAFIKEVLP